MTWEDGETFHHEIDIATARMANTKMEKSAGDKAPSSPGPYRATKLVSVVIYHDKFRV